MITFDLLELPETAPVFDPEGRYTTLEPSWYDADDLASVVKYQVLLQDNNNLYITDNEFISAMTGGGPMILSGILREVFKVEGVEDGEVLLSTMRKGGDYLTTHASSVVAMVDGIAPLRKRLAQERMATFIEQTLRG